MSSKQVERYRRLVEGPAKPEQFPSWAELDDVLDLLMDLDEFGVDAILGRVCRVLAAGEPGSIGFEQVGHLAVFVRRAREHMDTLAKNLDTLDTSLSFADEFAVEGGSCSIPGDDTLRGRMLSEAAKDLAGGHHA